MCKRTSSNLQNPQDSGDDLDPPDAAREATQCRISLRFSASAFFATFSNFSQIAESSRQRRRSGPPSWRPGGAQMPDYYINLDNRAFCQLSKQSPKAKTISELLQMTRRLLAGKLCGWPLVPNPHRKQESRLRNCGKRQEGWDCRPQTGPTTSARRKTQTTRTLRIRSRESPLLIAKQYF